MAHQPSTMLPKHFLQINEYACCVQSLLHQTPVGEICDDQGSSQIAPRLWNQSLFKINYFPARHLQCIWGVGIKIDRTACAQFIVGNLGRSTWQKNKHRTETPIHDFWRISQSQCGCYTITLCAMRLLFFWWVLNCQLSTLFPSIHKQMGQTNSRPRRLMYFFDVFCLCDANIFWRRYVCAENAHNWWALENR